MNANLLRFLRPVLLAALVAALFALAACGSSGPAASPSASPSPAADAVRAHVNGREVRQSDVEVVSAEARFDGRAQTAAAALKQAIDRELVRQEARRLGVSPTQAAVDARAAALATQAGGDGELSTLLQKARMSRAQLRASLLFSLTRQAVQDARYPALAAGAARVRAFYRRNQAKLFSTPASVDLAAVVTRNAGIGSNALKRLRQGRPFAEVARQFSVDPELKDNGGEMGWVYLTSMPPSLRKSVAAMHVGQLAPPVHGVGGWYIFKLLGRKPAKVTPFRTVRAELSAELTRRLRSAALDKWLGQARRLADISRS